MKNKNKKNLETNQNKIKTYLLLFSVLLFPVASVFSQTLAYDNFEGAKSLRYTEKSGVLDTAASNPAPNNINNSKTCALYVRNATKKFDNIKMSLSGKLVSVDAYATYTGIPPKLKMKIYTTAPVGTLVEILLGSKGRNNEYPAGTNSQYQAYTTVSGTWEELQFKFSQIPTGSETSPIQVDQITLLFNPNTSTSDTYYFDEITGPLLAAEKSESENSTVSTPEK